METPTDARARRITARALRVITRYTSPIFVGAGILLAFATVVAAEQHSLHLGKLTLVLFALLGLHDIVKPTARYIAKAADPDIRDGDTDTAAITAGFRKITSELRTGANPTDIHEAIARNKVLPAASTALEELASAHATAGRYEAVSTTRDAADALTNAARAMDAVTPQAQRDLR
ncbi:hypothetical protein ACFC1B_07195 [Streptomyces xiamenensis]|uniref:hypothetical protein n=1 Tax=Streptomyces xiamenensis TaxID=408015 RepID=UPI0035E34276